MEHQRQFDVAIAGAGPAGLAAAIAAATAGLSAVVFERKTIPIDKACGEGLLPPALAALEKLRVRSLIASEESAPIRSIQFIQPEGTTATALLAPPGALGVRRPVLSSALMKRAKLMGVEVNECCSILGFQRTDDAIEIDSTRGKERAKVLVAADGLNSALRKAAGLDGHLSARRRFGMRRHFRMTNPGSAVEVHFGRSAEAYVTPVNDGCVGVALLWSQRNGSAHASFDDLLGQFPQLASRLQHPDEDSHVAGAGPLARQALRQVSDRFVLIGDAAGYVDAITGEGLGLAFECALTLGRILPAAIRKGASRHALIPYERDFVTRFRRYSRRAHAMLFLARHAAIRRQAVGAFSRYPSLFETILKYAGP